MNKAIYGIESISVPEYKTSDHYLLNNDDEEVMVAKIYQRVMIGVRVNIPAAYISSKERQLQEAKSQAIAAITHSKDYDWLMAHNWSGHIPVFKYAEDYINDMLIATIDFYVNEQDYLVYLLGR